MSSLLNQRKTEKFYESISPQSAGAAHAELQRANDWLDEEHFIHILPLVFRVQRSDLDQRARPVQAVASAPGWEEELAGLPLPLLRTILGIAA